MAGQRQPGSWGLEIHPITIDEGTMCRFETPPPGPVRDDHRWTFSPGRTSPTALTSAVGHTSSDVDALSQAVADVQRSASWVTLERLVVSLLGPQTFGLGVVYGMGENVVGGVLGLAQLAKTFLLADLYDRAQQPGVVAVIGPLAAFQQLLAELSMRGFRQELAEAHAERDALIAELRYVVTHPLEVLGSIGAEYVEKWKRFEELSTQRTLSARFHAGRIFGEVLLDVLTLIGGGAAAVKAAAKIPRLARLARLRTAGKSAASAGRAAEAAAAVREMPVTPSQLRPAAPVAEAVPKAEAVRKDVYVLDRKGVPIGARQGKAKPGLPQKPLSKDGWPDLPADEARNFNSVEPVTLKPGTKIYRVIDDPESAAGRYWSEKLPASRAEWRSEFAVKTNWNTNGQYVEYTVPEGPGLKVWRGETAAQQLRPTSFYLPGGGQQIYMPKDYVIPSPPKPTGW